MVHLRIVSALHCLDHDADQLLTSRELHDVKILIVRKLCEAMLRNQVSRRLGYLFIWRLAAML